MRLIRNACVLAAASVVITSPLASAQSPVTTDTITADRLVTPTEPAFWDFSPTLDPPLRIVSPLGDSVPVTCQSFHSQSFNCTQTAADGTTIRLDLRTAFTRPVGSSSPSIGTADSTFDYLIAEGFPFAS